MRKSICRWCTDSHLHRFFDLENYNRPQKLGTAVATVRDGLWEVWNAPVDDFTSHVRLLPFLALALRDSS